MAQGGRREGLSLKDSANSHENSFLRSAPLHWLLRHRTRRRPPDQRTDTTSKRSVIKMSSFWLNPGCAQREIPSRCCDCAGQRRCIRRSSGSSDRRATSRHAPYPTDKVRMADCPARSSRSTARHRRPCRRDRNDWEEMIRPGRCKATYLRPRYRAGRENSHLRRNWLSYDRGCRLNSTPSACHRPQRIPPPPRSVIDRVPQQVNRWSERFSAQGYPANGQRPARPARSRKRRDLGRSVQSQDRASFS